MYLIYQNLSASNLRIVYLLCQYLPTLPSIIWHSILRGNVYEDVMQFDIDAVDNEAILWKDNVFHGSPEIIVSGCK